MNFKKINEQVEELIKLNNQLAQMKYNDPLYDELEEKIHGIQDHINDSHKDYFEDVIEEIYGKLKSDDDILNFSDYIAKTYVETEKNTYGTQYDVSPEGCIVIGVSHANLKGKTVNGKMYVKPNPLRLIFSLGGIEKVMWTSEDVAV